jgi:Na+/melibiose symporter-like transporter
MDCNTLFLIIIKHERCAPIAIANCNALLRSVSFFIHRAFLLRSTTDRANTEHAKKHSTKRIESLGLTAFQNRLLLSHRVLQILNWIVHTIRSTIGNRNISSYNLLYIR